MSFPLANLDICFLAGTLGQGGAERQLFYILQALQGAGARVRLLSLTRGEYWEDRIRALGVEVSWVGREDSRLARLKTIVGRLRTDIPRVIQSQHFYTNLYATLAARWLGAAEIGALRSDVYSEVRSNGRVLGPLSLRLPRTLVANSVPAIRNAIAAGVPGGRLHYLPNIVDTEHFSPGTAERQGPVQVLAVGRLVKVKRHDRLLRALAAAGREVEIRGVIAGGGPLLAELQAMSPAGVRFAGDVSDPASLYASSDLLALTSDYEGTPNVLLEAMACGLPVVSTRVGSAPEIVQDGVTGFLVEPADEDALAARVLELARHAELRRAMGEKGRQFVLRHYAKNRLPLELERIYAAVVPRPGSPAVSHWSSDAALHR